jgi:hypothetical protein
VSAGKVGTLDLKSKKITAAVLPRSGLKRPGLQRPPARGSQTQILQGPGTSGTQTKGKEKLHTCGLVRLGLNILTARGPHTVLVNVRGGPEPLVRAIKRRCPSRLGNRAVPGLLGRASEWLLSVKATGDPDLQGKFCKRPANDWWAYV